MDRISYFFDICFIIILFSLDHILENAKSEPNLERVNQEPVDNEEDFQENKENLAPLDEFSDQNIQ